MWMCGLHMGQALHLCCMKLYGLIGYPIAHSYSAAFFTDKFAAMGLEDHRYVHFPLTSIDLLPQLIHENPFLCGLNVTIPYKRAVIHYLNEVSSAATAIGAVNTIVISEYFLSGYNTDWIGFMQALEPYMKRLGPDTEALILGTGGSSSAVAFALGHLGITHTRVSRRPAPGLLTSNDLTKEVIAAHRLIVQTTPLGMFPNVTDVPGLDYAGVTRDHLLFDLIYNPAETEFLRRGRERGAVTLNGMEMLKFQADAAWQKWQDASTI